jgi:hypothetical protein
MSDANELSEIRRAAANARWQSQGAVRAAQTTVERADELDLSEGTVDELSMAISRFRPGFLPRRSEQLIAREDRIERQAARLAEREKAERIEARRSADLAWAASQAAERGEAVSALALATGQVPGRDIGDVLADAAAQADREDARAEIDARRQRGEKLQLVGELEPATRSAPLTETGRAIERRSERFRDRLAAQRRLDELDGCPPRYVP